MNADESSLLAPHADAPARTVWFIAVRPAQAQAFLPSWDEYLAGNLDAAEVIEEDPVFRLGSGDLVGGESGSHCRLAASIDTPILRRIFQAAPPRRGTP